MEEYLPQSCVQTSRALCWVGTLDLGQDSPILRKYFRSLNKSLANKFGRFTQNTSNRIVFF